MIYFQVRPDEILTLLVEESITVDLILLEGETESGWREGNTPATRCFSLDLAITGFQKIIKAHRSEEVYQLSDYLWLLLYECLKTNCEIHNDYARMGDYPGGLIQIGRYRIRRIDFGNLVDTFFWDLDFLPHDDGFVPSRETRDSIGMSQQVFGIHSGLPPHSEELELTRVVPQPWGEAGDLFRDGSECYPDVSET